MWILMLVPIPICYGLFVRSDRMFWLLRFQMILFDTHWRCFFEADPYLVEWLCWELNCIEIQRLRYVSDGLTPIPNKIYTYNTQSKIV